MCALHPVWYRGQGYEYAASSTRPQESRLDFFAVLRLYTTSNCRMQLHHCRNRVSNSLNSVWPINSDPGHGTIFSSNLSIGIASIHLMPLLCRRILNLCLRTTMPGCGCLNNSVCPKCWRLKTEGSCLDTSKGRWSFAEWRVSLNLRWIEHSCRRFLFGHREWWQNHHGKAAPWPLANRSKTFKPFQSYHKCQGVLEELCNCRT